MLELRPDELAVLEHAARTVDELARLGEALADAPMTVPGSKGQPRAHPLLDEVRRHREVLGRLLQRLDVPDGGEAPAKQPNNVQRGALSRWEAHREAQRGASA